MSSRTWLAKAKHLYDLGNHLYTLKPGQEWDDKRESLAMRNRVTRYSQPLPVAEEFMNLYGARMHDAYILGMERSRDEFTLRLHCRYADNFDHHLSKILGVAPHEKTWPVELRLTGVNFVRSARPDLYGNLRFFDWRRIGGMRKTGRDEFIDDWFFQENGRLQWIAELWLGAWRHTAGSPDVYLMIDCAAASGVDLRANALVKLFGESVLPIWNDATHQIGCDDNIQALWTADYIRDRMKFHGLTPRDFLCALM